jgi:succinoglycan biosynthesis transport protein ExoP
MQSILPNQIGISPDERNNQLLRLKQTLTSNENLVRVVRRTDLNSLVASDADLASVVAGLRQRITITAQPDGGLEIKASSNISGFSNGQNARTAAGTVQGLIDAFNEQNLSGDRREASQSLQFLDEELRRREVALQEAEQRRVEFDQRFMGVLPGAGSIADRMTAAQAELANLEQQIAGANGSLPRCAPSSPRPRRPSRPAPARIAARPPGRSQRSKASSTATSPRAGPNPIPTWSRSASRSPGCGRSPPREARNGGGGGMSNPSYVSLRAMMAEREATLAAATARRNQLTSDLGQLTSRQSTEPGLAAEQARLTRDYDVLKQQYDQLLANREQVRLRSDVQSRTSPLSVQVVDPPSVPTVPASPNRPIFLTAVLILGLGAGASARPSSPASSRPPSRPRTSSPR